MFSKNIVLIFGVIIFLSEINVASAVSLSIQTDKTEYNYGDLLSFVIKISNITEKTLTLHIRDESGKNSQPIVLTITNTTTTITAKEPFAPSVYKPGIYYLDAEYADAKDSTSFRIIDSDKIVIPSAIKTLAELWYKGLATDKDFGRGIDELIKEKIIIIPESEHQDSNNDTKIPTWFKTNAGWWTNNLISDSDFALGMQYLIRNGIIVA